MLRSDKARIVIRLLTPAFHGGDEKTGSEVLFRRLKFIVDDRIEEVPYISGNEVRGQLRRLIMMDFLRLAGYEIRTLRLYHSLFSGGVLEEAREESTPRLDIELRRRIRRLIPPVSLLGMAYRNQVIEGKLKFMHLLPICREVREYLPDDIVNRFGRWVERSFYDYLDWTFHTRHADERDRHSEQAIQMMYRFEVLIPGTLLYTEIICEDCTDIELSCLSRMIRLWMEHPYIGGRTSTGYGKIAFEHVDTTFNIDDKRYIEYINENRNEIARLLQELDR